MIFFKILGWVLLSLIALIIIALCIRVRIIAEYSEEKTSVVLKWLFLSFPLYPSQKKEKAEKTAEEEKTDAAVSDAQTSAEEAATDTKQESAKDNNADTQADLPPEKKQSFLSQLYNAEGIDGIILLVKRIFSYLGTFFGKLLYAPVIDELHLDVCCTRSDAASTAVYYGEVCTALFPMLGALVSSCRVKKYAINVYPDFIARFSSASFYVNLHVVPIYLIGIILALAFKLLFKVLLRVLVKIFLPKKSKA